MAAKKKTKKRNKPRKTKTEWLGSGMSVGLDACVIVWVDRKTGELLESTLCRIASAEVALKRSAQRLIEKRGKPNGRLCVLHRTAAVPLRRMLGVPVGIGFDDKARNLVWTATNSVLKQNDEATVPLAGGEPLYTLDVTLQQIEPPIRRRIRIAGDVSLGTLHEVLQVAMGWEDCHLHQFNIGDERYASFDENAGGNELDENAFEIREVLRKGDRATYWYDFGDDWMHDIVVSDVTDAAPGDAVASCVDGARACPPEDCGGAWGYSNKLRALAEPQDDDDHELAEWMGDFDPEAFDCNAADRYVKALFVIGPMRGLRSSGDGRVLQGGQPE